MDIIKLLTERVGVSEEQARSGLGIILKLLQSQLEGTEYEMIANYVPMAAQLVGAAPELSQGGSGGIMGIVEKVMSFFGQGSQLGGLAQVASTFSEAGMQPEQAAAFVPVLTSFLQEQGGDEVAGLVTKILG